MTAGSRPIAAVWFPLALLALLIAWPAAERVRAAAPEVELIVADLRADELLLIDTASGSVRDRIALPGGAHELLALPDGRIAVSIEQQGVLAIVDLASSEVKVIPVGGTPHGLALDRDRLLVTDRATDQVRRFEVDGWQELEPLGTGRWPHAVALMPDGRLALALAGDSMLTLGDDMIEVSALPETVSVASDGAVATAGASGGELQIFSPTGTEELRVALGGRPVRVVFAPDGQRIAVALSASGEVALVDRTGTIRRVSVPGVPDGLAFSPSGNRLYVSDVVNGGVAVVDAKSMRLLRVIDAGEATGAILVR